jgi:hypothetical protein
MFQRIVAMQAIAIANTFGVVVLAVAIGTVFARVYAPMAVILVHRSMVLMDPMAA